MLNIFHLVAGPGFTRFLLAILVFIFHVSKLALGLMAVYLFFILSGYWIARMWRSRYSKIDNPYFWFVISRFWRLLPMFALGSLLSFLVAMYTHKLDAVTSYGHLAFSSIFILGYKSLVFLPNIPAWSLDIEMQFYLVAPLLIYCIVSQKAWGGYVAFMLVAIVSFFATYYKESATVLPYLGFFCLGVLIASKKLMPPKSLALAFLLVAVLAIIFILLSPYRGLLLLGHSPDPISQFNNLVSVCLAILITPYVIYTTSLKSSKSDSMFGDLSYVVYLIHWSLLKVIDTGHGDFMTRSLLILFAFFVTFIISYLLWRFIDLPINKMRSRYINAKAIV